MSKKERKERERGREACIQIIQNVVLQLILTWLYVYNAIGI